MPTEMEIDAAAKAYCCPECECAPAAEYCAVERRRDMIRRLLMAAETERERRRVEDCRHSNKYQSGTIASDGSSSWSWFCRDCGKSGTSSTPPRPPDTNPPPMLWNEVASRRAAEARLQAKIGT